MRDDLGVEEFIEDVGTRVRSIDRYEVTSYQVLVLFRGQRCLTPRCSALQTSCCVRYLALVTFEALDRPSIRWKPSWRSEATSGGPSRSGSNPPVEYQPRPKRLDRQSGAIVTRGEISPCLVRFDQECSCSHRVLPVFNAA